MLFYSSGHCVGQLNGSGGKKEREKEIERERKKERKKKRNFKLTNKQRKEETERDRKIASQVVIGVGEERNSSECDN